MENKKIDMTMLANYVRVRPSDKEKLAELVIRAKGAKRSMRQFALDCGVNPSTLSRIVNKKTAGSNSDELVMSIAENADPESGVTFEMLMDAHGKVIKQMSGKVRRESSIIMEHAIGDIIFRELLVRGYSIAATKDEISHNALNYRYRTDWAVRTDAISDKGQLELWEFEFWPSLVEGDKNMRYLAMKLRQKFLMVLGLYYTGDMNAKKMSFVVTEMDLFDLLVSSLQGISFDNLFSLIWVDLEKAEIGKEFVFPVNGKAAMPEVFFPVEKEEDEESAEETLEDELDWNDVLFEE